MRTPGATSHPERRDSRESTGIIPSAAAWRDTLDGVDPWPMVDRCARKGWQNGGAGIKPGPLMG